MWGSNLQPGDQESQALPTKPAPLGFFLKHMGAIIPLSFFLSLLSFILLTFLSKFLTKHFQVPTEPSYYSQLAY